MRVLVNGVHLYFDVEGSALRPEGPRMVQKPTLLLLHGGPGADHTVYKPEFSKLSDVAQIIYLDHRGNGRSDLATPESWNLKTWAADVKGFCDALDIQKPIVYGASFGGMVAMQYAVDFPEHPSKLILVSTAADWNSHTQAKVDMFARLGGPSVGELAHRRFVLGDTSPDVLARWLTEALPLYTQTGLSPDWFSRQMSNREVTAWFNRDGGDARTFNVLPHLHKVQCPTLVVGGSLDPMLPIEYQRDIAKALPKSVLTYQEFAHCGHSVMNDDPESFCKLLRNFISQSPD